MPTSRSPFGVTIAPLPFPDFQTDINKQLSFWNTMQQMQRRAAGISGGGGHTVRNANGLTPYQQAQMDYKKAKDEAKAAEAEAKKNIMLGLDPVTKEPIIYRNESGQNLTQKDRDRLLADELQRRLKNAAGQDVELNKALGELNSGTELSTQRRSELQRVVRDRTKALGRSYGIDDRATFDAIIGPSKQILDEQRQALRNDSFLDTVWAGMRKGGNALYYAATMPFMSDAERLEAAEQMRKEQEAITRSSPTLQERALVEAEAAREGKDVGYMQTAQANLASNIGASVADTVTSFAPAIAAGMIPVVGTYAAPFLAGGIGAGLNQVSQAARVEADPNLTEAQKQQALSYSDPGFVTTTGIGGLTGLLMPGGVGSGIVRGAGSAAFRRAAAAGPINPATVPGLTGRALRAGARATERANAPRSLAALSRDVPVNMAENAGLMAANTVGANVAYNMSTGQPLTQGAMEGVGRAAMEGAVVGVPFGIGRTLRRRAAPTVQATTEGTVSSTREPANTQPVSIFEQAMKADTAAQEWKRDLLKTVVNPRKVKTEAADKLIAEYLDTVDTTVDGWRDEMSARLVSIDDLPRWNKMNDNSAAALRKVVDTWKGALDDGTIAEKIASNYQRPAEGESRLASYMGELERVRAKRAAGQDTRDDSSMEADSAKRASDAASRSAVPDNASGAKTSGGGDGGSAAQNSGPSKTPSAASPQAGREGTPASQQPANAGSPRPSSVEAGDGTRVVTLAPERGDGSKSNAATTSGSEQPVSWRVIPPDHAEAITANNKARETFENTTTGVKYVRIGNEWYKVEKKTDKNGKEVTRRSKADSTTRRILNSVSREAAKSTNPKGEVKESRFLPRQQYSSAGTSRKQIPESFKKIAWTQGTRNLDIGAGAFELGTDYLRSRGVENTPFDPYNRATDVNNAALDTLRNGEKYDTVTVANLLNVVQEPEIRDNIIKQAAHSVKPDGKAYFQVYESDRSGVGRQTKTGGTDDNWQNARTLKSYQPDIERHFGKVESKDGMLIASEPRDPGPVEWQLNRDGDTVRASYNTSDTSLLSDKLIEKCFHTPEEKALLERLRNGTDDIVVRADGTGFDDMGSYYDVVRQVADIILARFPGMKKRNIELYTPYSDEIATYSISSGDVGLNAADIFNSPDPVATILRLMGHELGGHGESRELAPPSARTDLYRTAFSSVDSQTHQVFKDAYASRASEAGMASADYFGEEVYSEMYAGNPEQFLADIPAESVRQNLLTFFNTVVRTPTERTEALQKVLTFLARHADAMTFKDVAVEALLSSKEHTSLFLGSRNDFLSFLDDYSSSTNSVPAWVHLVSDYKNITEIADVPRNKETLRIYLDELLDPTTELNVFKRQSVVC